MGVETSSYDVFFSYNTRDRAAVDAVAQALKGRGLQIFLDRWCLTPGLAWPQSLEKNLSRSRSFAIFIGSEGMGSWQQRELFLALERQGRDPSFPVIPVLLPGSDPPLGFLQQNTWVDLSGGFQDDRLLDILEAAVRGVPPGPDAATHIERIRATTCPYRGLQPFREEDGPLFRGRAAAIDRLFQAVSGQSFVALVGSSGSGKSSLVQAGLVPRLRAGTDEHRWEIATVRPGEMPLHALMSVLSPPPEDLSRAQRLSRVHNDVRALRERGLSLRAFVDDILSRQPGTDRFLLVIDQFEELYAAPVTAQDRERFIQLIIGPSDDGPLRVVLTLRADFFDRIVRDRMLGDRIEGTQVLLGPMTRTELGEAIESPAEAGGLGFESGLVERILDDVGDDSANLPLLEFVLKELWEHRRGALLTNDAYGEIGGIRGAIAARADAVFQGLSAKQQQAARRVLLQTVRLGERAEQPTRRLAVIDEGDRAAWEVIARLADQRARLVVTGREAGRPVVTVTHEALIRSWGRLAGWTQEERDYLRLRERVEAAAGLWERQDRSPERLLAPGIALAEAEALLAARRLDLDSALIEYIEASAQAERRRRDVQNRAERRRLVRARIAAGLMAALALIAIGVGFYAFDRAQLAEEQRQQALARYLATQARILAESAAGNPASVRRATALAIESWRRMPNGDAYAVAAQLLSRIPSRPIASGPMLQLGLNPNGRTLFVSDNNGFRLIAATTGKTLKQIGGQVSMHNVDFDRTGKRILVETVAADPHEGGAFQLIDTATGDVVFAADEGAYSLHTYATSNGFMRNTATLSPNGRWLAAIAADRVTIIDALTGILVAGITIGNGRGDAAIRELLFAPGSDLIGLLSNGLLRLFELPDARQVASISMGRLYDHQFAANDRLLALLDCTGQPECTARIRVIDTSTGIEKQSRELGPGYFVAWLNLDGSTLRISGDQPELDFDLLSGALTPIDRASSDRSSSTADDCRELYLETPGAIRLMACGEGRIHTIDRQSGKQIAGFDVRGTVTPSGELSPDGRFVLTVDRNTYHLYESATGIETREGFFLQSARSFEPRRLFSADSDALVVPAYSDGVEFMDLSGPHRGTLLELPEREPTVPSRDRRVLATGRDDPFLRLFDAETGAQRTVLRREGAEGQVRPLWFSRDGKRLFAATERAIQLIEIGSGKILASFPQKMGFDLITHFSDDSAFVTRSGDDVSLVDVESGREVAGFPLGPGHGSSWNSRFAQGKITLAEVLESDEFLATQPAQEGKVAVSGYAFSPVDRLMATVSPRVGLVRLIDIDSGKLRQRLQLKRRPYHVAFSPDGRTLAVSVHDNSVRLIDVATGAELRRLHYTCGPGYISMAYMAFSGDSRVLALYDGEREQVSDVWLFDVRTGRQLAHAATGRKTMFSDRPRGRSWSSQLRFSPDSRLFAFGPAGNDPVQLFEAATGRELLRIPLGEGLKNVAFSPDGRYLAASSESGAGSVVVTETLEQRGFWQHANVVMDWAFSADGQYFATASWDGSVRMIETETGREVARFEHGAPVREVEFLANGKSLLTTDTNGRKRLWSSDPSWPFEHLCHRMGRNFSRADWKALFDREEWRPTCTGWDNPIASEDPAENTQAPR
jgi:WD40 repeat protein